MIPEDLEVTIARESEAGREALSVLRKVRTELTGQQRLEKSFELTELSRQLMRAGIVEANPEYDENQVQRLYIDRLLGHHGLSLNELRMRQNSRKSGETTEEDERVAPPDNDQNE